MKTIVLSALLLLALSACNTIAGLGRDMKNAGGYMESVGD